MYLTEYKRTITAIQYTPLLEGQRQASDLSDCWGREEGDEENKYSSAWASRTNK